MSEESKAWKQIRKLLSQEEINELEAAPLDRLRAVISECEQNILEQETARDADEQLSAAKQQVKDLGAGYREAIAAQRAKQRAAAYIVVDRCA